MLQGKSRDVIIRKLQRTVSADSISNHKPLMHACVHTYIHSTYLCLCNGCSVCVACMRVCVCLCVCLCVCVCVCVCCVCVCVCVCVLCVCVCVLCVCVCVCVVCVCVCVVCTLVRCCGHSLVALFLTSEDFVVLGSGIMDDTEFDLPAAVLRRVRVWICAAVLTYILTYVCTYVWWYTFMTCICTVYTYIIMCACVCV